MLHDRVLLASLRATAPVPLIRSVRACSSECLGALRVTSYREQRCLDLAVPAPPVPAPPGERLDGLVAAPVPMSTGEEHMLDAADVAASHATGAPIFAPSDEDFV